MLNQNNQGFIHSQRGLMFTLTPGIVEKGQQRQGEHWLVWVGQKLPGIITRFEPRSMGEGDMAGQHACSRQISLVSQATSVLIVACVQHTYITHQSAGTLAVGVHICQPACMQCIIFNGCGLACLKQGIWSAHIFQGCQLDQSQWAYLYFSWHDWSTHNIPSQLAALLVVDQHICWLAHLEHA